MIENVTVSSAPHVSQPLSTRRIMIDVIVALAPAIVFAVFYFRLYALTLICTCVLSAVATEWLCNVITKRSNSLGDFSAVLTGIILALSLPPTLPVWVAVIGSVFSIAIGKMVFGGLGANIFNPAMVGRTFLAACFGMMMTTWTLPATIDGAMPTISPANTSVDARTQATPLALGKQAIKTKKDAQVVDSQLSVMFVGEVGGCLGETSGWALLLGAVYLLIRRTINFHIPLAILLSTYAIGAFTHIIDPDAYVRPLSHLVSGGMLLCAFFIATDPVTCPLTTKGMWMFGIGVGAITMLIRIVGEYPEGVMYAILLMNAVSPLIDRFCKPVPAGGKPGV